MTATVPLYWLVLTGFVCFYAGMALVAVLVCGKRADEAMGKEREGR